jgi:DNA-binding NtrC family response regulator
VERHFIGEALKTALGNKTEAASLLCLSRRSFQHRMERTDYEVWAARQAKKMVFRLKILPTESDPGEQ